MLINHKERLEMLSESNYEITTEDIKDYIQGEYEVNSSAMKTEVVISFCRIQISKKKIEESLKELDFDYSKLENKVYIISKIN